MNKGCVPIAALHLWSRHRVCVPLAHGARPQAAAADELPQLALGARSKADVAATFKCSCLCQLTCLGFVPCLLGLHTGGVWLSRYPGSVAGRRTCMTYGIRTATSWEPSAPERVSWVTHSDDCRGYLKFTGSQNARLKADLPATLPPTGLSSVQICRGSCQKA
jgi:hypothetical protein